MIPGESPLIRSALDIGFAPTENGRKPGGLQLTIAVDSYEFDEFVKYLKTRLILKLF
jgi:hypothetical protein